MIQLGLALEHLKLDKRTQDGVLHQYRVAGCKPAQHVLWAHSATLGLGIWAEFAWPYLVARRQEMWTLSIGLFNSAGAAGSGGDPMVSSSMAVMSAIPTLFIFTFFQRYLVGSIALTGIKG
jgi:ABC-type glycerol-3-phosphate transport system permease component